MPSLRDSSPQAGPGSLQLALIWVGGVRLAAATAEILHMVPLPLRPSPDEVAESAWTMDFVDLGQALFGATPAWSEDNALLLVQAGEARRAVVVDRVEMVVEVPLTRVWPLPEIVGSSLQNKAPWGVADLGDELVVIVELGGSAVCC